MRFTFFTEQVVNVPHLKTEKYEIEADSYEDALEMIKDNDADLDDIAEWQDSSMTVLDEYNYPPICGEKVIYNENHEEVDVYIEVD